MLTEPMLQTCAPRAMASYAPFGVLFETSETSPRTASGPGAPQEVCASEGCASASEAAMQARPEKWRREAHDEAAGETTFIPNPPQATDYWKYIKSGRGSAASTGFALGIGLVTSAVARLMGDFRI